MDSHSSRVKAWWLAAALAAVVVLAGGVALLVQHDDNDDNTALGEPTASSSSDAADDGEAWLFSYTARSGSMVEQPDGTYLLTLEQTDEHITAFTDRPDRDSAIVPATALFEEWSNLFADSPPNAVLVEHDPVGGTDSWVVELTDPTLDGTTATFTATVLGEEDHTAGARRLANELYDTPPAQFRAVSLFIDDVDTGSAANKSQFHPTKVA